MTIAASARTAATFSSPEMRATLTRIWAFDRPLIGFVGTNPGKASATVDDMTARKYRGFAERWGFGGYIAVNLWQWIATDMHELIARLVAGLPCNPSPQDLAPIWDLLVDCEAICLAWGRPQPRIRHQWQDRVHVVLDALALTGRPLVVAGRNKDGSPVHLSRYPYTNKPIAITERISA